MADSKKYYWIKLRTDFFNREDIDFLLSQENGCEYVVLYQMLCLNTANTNGRLESQMNEVIVPYDTKKIVRDCKYFDIDTVVVALELYKKLGLIYEEENKILKIANIERMIGSESASREAIKKREQRLKAKVGTIEGTNCLIENRDKILDIRDKSIDKDNKKQDLKELIEKNEYFSTNEKLKEALEQWLDYKKERKEYYKEIGFKSLLTQIQKASEEYGQDKVVDLINECMASLYKGILFDKLKQEKERQQTKPSARELRDKEFERKLAEGYFDDVM